MSEFADLVTPASGDWNSAESALFFVDQPPLFSFKVPTAIREDSMRAGLVARVARVIRKVNVIRLVMKALRLVTDF